MVKEGQLELLKALSVSKKRQNQITKVISDNNKCNDQLKDLLKQIRAAEKAVKIVGDATFMRSQEGVELIAHIKGRHMNGMKALSGSYKTIASKHADIEDFDDNVKCCSERVIVSKRCASELNKILKKLNKPVKVKVKSIKEPAGPATPATPPPTKITKIAARKTPRKNPKPTKVVVKKEIFQEDAEAVEDAATAAVLEAGVVCEGCNMPI